MPWLPSSRPWYRQGQSPPNRAEARRAARYAQPVKTDDFIALGKKLGIQVHVTEPKPGRGEIVLIPGIRKPKSEPRWDDLLEDDDGSGVVE
jgi:hypothetical protein